MALFEWAVAAISANVAVAADLVLCYLFYLTLRLAKAYHKTHDNRRLIFATLVLLGAFELWSRVHGENVQAFFEQFRVLLVMVPLAVFLIYTILESKRQRENEEKKKIRAAFGQYVSPSLVNEIMRHPEKLKLGGEKKRLTVFFSDIRGFTTLSEKLSPEELVSLLNEYLNGMTNIIINQKGLVDKYIGDAIMAFWGAPLDDEEHAVNACKSGLMMKDALTKISANLEKRGLPGIKIGMGINTGDMVVGNMGSSQRFDYTVIGDNVNLASRLEGLTKQYGVGILITEDTHNAIKGKGFLCREIDLVTVKGKTKPVRLFELVDFEKNSDKALKDKVKRFETALKEYREGGFAKAKKGFLAIEDETSKIFADRCSQYIRSPPKDWKGVHVATSK